MTNDLTEEVVLFFASPEEIDLECAAERFVELAEAMGADADSATMLGPLDLLINGDGLRITLSICDAPLAADDFLKAERPEGASQDDDVVFTATALHEAALVLRVTATNDGEAKIERLASCIIGRMPVCAAYTRKDNTLYAACEYLDGRRAIAPVAPRRVRAAAPSPRAQAAAAASLPDMALSEAAVAETLNSATLIEKAPEPAERAFLGGLTGRLVAAARHPLGRIFSQDTA